MDFELDAFNVQAVLTEGSLLPLASSGGGGGTQGPPDVKALEHTGGRKAWCIPRVQTSPFALSVTEL